MKISIMIAVIPIILLYQNCSNGLEPITPRLALGSDNVGPGDDNSTRPDLEDLIDTELSKTRIGNYGYGAFVLDKDKSLYSFNSMLPIEDNSPGKLILGPETVISDVDFVAHNSGSVFTFYNNRTKFKSWGSSQSGANCSSQYQPTGFVRKVLTSKTAILILDENELIICNQGGLIRFNDAQFDVEKSFEFFMDTNSVWAVYQAGKLYVHQSDNFIFSNYTDNVHNLGGTLIWRDLSSQIWTVASLHYQFYGPKEVISNTLGAKQLDGMAEHVFLIDRGFNFEPEISKKIGVIIPIFSKTTDENELEYFVFSHNPSTVSIENGGDSESFMIQFPENLADASYLYDGVVTVDGVYSMNLFWPDWGWIRTPVAKLTTGDCVSGSLYGIHEKPWAADIELSYGCRTSDGDANFSNPEKATERSDIQNLTTFLKDLNKPFSIHSFWQRRGVFIHIDNNDFLVLNEGFIGKVVKNLVVGSIGKFTAIDSENNLLNPFGVRYSSDQALSEQESQNLIKSLALEPGNIYGLFDKLFSYDIQTYTP
ncbi:MAG: hypothetical protein AB8E15_04930 [Bdellovibrionales bacterium]